MWWSGWPSRAPAAPVEVKQGDMVAQVLVDQTRGTGEWNYVGTFELEGLALVSITNPSSEYSVCADAIQFVPREG
jgi:hypothetical protein